MFSAWISAASSADPDFYFGLEVIADTFPDARVLATPTVIDHIQHSYESKLKAWSMLGSNLPTRLVEMTPFTDDAILVDGERLELRRPRRHLRRRRRERRRPRSVHRHPPCDGQRARRPRRTSFRRPRRTHRPLRTVRRHRQGPRRRRILTGRQLPSSQRSDRRSVSDRGPGHTHGCTSSGVLGARPEHRPRRLTRGDQQAHRTSVPNPSIRARWPRTRARDRAVDRRHACCEPVDHATERWWTVYDGHVPRRSGRTPDMSDGRTHIRGSGRP